MISRMYTTRGDNMSKIEDAQRRAEHCLEVMRLIEADTGISPKFRAQLAKNLAADALQSIATRINDDKAKGEKTDG